jgi:uncharacterized protein (DUF1778 family)
MTKITTQQHAKSKTRKYLMVRYFPDRERQVLKTAAAAIGQTLEQYVTNVLVDHAATMGAAHDRFALKAKGGAV